MCIEIICTPAKLYMKSLLCYDENDSKEIVFTVNKPNS